MDRDEDLAASLPRPPLPAPARRQAAIEEAMRRFDGGDASPAAAATSGGRSSAAGPWWREPARSWAPALATIVLALLLILPVARSVIGDQPPVGGGDRPGEAARAPASGPQIATSDPDGPARGAAPEAPASEAEAAAAVEERKADPDQTADLAMAQAEPPPPPAPAAPPPAARGDSKAEAADRRAEESFASAGSPVTVTGSRVRRPDVAAAAQESVSDEATIITTATRSAKASGRGDWNACTVDDPKRSLAGCRHLVDPKARGASGQASARLAEGLSSAWRGDNREAIASFDQAIAVAPRSAFAYLNRGLAWKREGNLDRALADLDQAVKQAPRTARLYYHRSRILRQRGDERRARADEQRAVNLDPAYGAVLP